MLNMLHLTSSKNVFLMTCSKQAEDKRQLVNINQLEEGKENKKYLRISIKHIKNQTQIGSRVYKYKSGIIISLDSIRRFFQISK